MRTEEATTVNFRNPAKHSFPAAMMLAVAVGIAASLSTPATLAQDTETGQSSTVAVIAASGIDQLLTDIDFLGNLVGAPSARQQAESMLRLFTGNNKLPGVDDTKVWGSIIRTDGDNFEPIVCIPVTDLGALLNMLQNFQINVTDLGEGLSELELPNQSLYIKEANGWAFAAQTPESLDEVPGDPAQELGQVADQYDLAVRLMMPNIPPTYREIAITNLRAGIEDGLEQGEEESDEDFAQRRKAAEQQFEELRRIFDEINEMTIGINIDPDNKHVVLDFTYSAVAGTRTARELENFSNAQTRFGKLLTDDAVLQFNMVNQVAAEDLAAYQAELDAAMTSNRVTILQQVENSDDLSEEERQIAEKLIPPAMDLLAAFLREGKVDIVGNVILADSKLNGAIATAGNTSEVENFLNALETAATDHPEKLTFTKNAANHNGVALHEVKVTLSDEVDEKAKELLGGDSATIYLGVASEALYIAIGADALASIQGAIDAADNAPATEITPVQFKLAVGPILQQAMQEDDFAGNPVIQQLAAKVIEDGNDHIIVTFDKVGQLGRGRIVIEQGVIEAINGIGRAAAPQFAP